MCVCRTLQAGGGDGKGETLEHEVMESEPVTGTPGLCLLPRDFLAPHSAVSCLLAEFDIWYNESFFIPEDMQMALKPGSSIRPGLLPISRIVSLVSGTRTWAGMMSEHGVVSSAPRSLFSPQTWRCAGRSEPLPQLAQAGGQLQVSTIFKARDTENTNYRSYPFVWLILPRGSYRVSVMMLATRAL